MTGTHEEPAARRTAARARQIAHSPLTVKALQQRAIAPGELPPVSAP